jgi:hypothetical protein
MAATCSLQVSQSLVDSDQDSEYYLRPEKFNITVPLNFDTKPTAHITGQCDMCRYVPQQMEEEILRREFANWLRTEKRSPDRADVQNRALEQLQAMPGDHWNPKTVRDWFTNHYKSLPPASRPRTLESRGSLRRTADGGNPFAEDEQPPQPTDPVSVMPPQLPESTGISPVEPVDVDFAPSHEPPPAIPDVRVPKIPPGVILDTDKGAYLPIQVTKRYPHEKRHTVRTEVGSVRELDSDPELGDEVEPDNDRVEAVTFILNLPNGWEGEYKATTTQDPQRQRRATIFCIGYVLRRMKRSTCSMSISRTCFGEFVFMTRLTPFTPVSKTFITRAIASIRWAPQTEFR